MYLGINLSKIAALCPDEYSRFSEAHDKFTEFNWEDENGRTLGEAFKYVCDRVADSVEIDSTRGRNLKESIKALIQALDSKGIHRVVPKAAINLDMKWVTIRFTIPETAVFTRVLTEDGKRILTALNATEDNLEDTFGYLA